MPTPIEIKVLDKAINIPSKEIIKKDYKKHDLLQEIEKNKDNPLKLIELKKLYIDLLNKEQDKEEILKLELEIAELLIAHKNIILENIEILFNSIASNSNKRDDFVKKIDEIQKDKDTIIDLNAHLHKIKEEFDKKVISSKEEISEIVNLLQKTVNQETLDKSLKETFNQETLTESLNSIDKKIGEIQEPVIPEEIQEIPNTLKSLSKEIKEEFDKKVISSKEEISEIVNLLQKTVNQETLTESLKETFNQEELNKSLTNINDIKESSNEILKGIDSNHNQQTILTIGLLFVLSILVFVLVFILIFFRD